MLESLHISNFRSCEDVHLRLGEPVVVLVGKNGAGKTNILHAIQLAAELCIGEPDSAFGLSPRDIRKPTRFDAEFSLGESLYRFEVARTTPSVEGEKAFPEIVEHLERDDRILFGRKGEILDLPDAEATAHDILRVGTRLSSVTALMQLLSPDHLMHGELRPVAEFFRAVRYYPLIQGFQEHSGDLSHFIEVSKYENWKVQLAQARAARSVQMRLLHMHLAAPEQMNELRALVGDNGLGLIANIDVIEVDRPKRGLSDGTADGAYSIFFHPCSGLAGAGRRFRFSGLSAGTWRVLQLLTYLVFDKSSVMLLEQPEDCIHAGLLAKLFDILQTYSHRTQLICTTHSASVMNLVGSAGIRLVTAEDGRTAVSELSPAQLEASQSYLSDEGTLAEFLETL